MKILLVAFCAALCTCEAKSFDTSRGGSAKSRRSQGSQGSDGSQGSPHSQSDDHPSDTDIDQLARACGWSDQQVDDLWDNPNPVTPDELKASLTGFSQTVDLLVPMFDAHNEQIVAIEAALDGPVHQLIDNHRNLVETFSQNLKNASASGMCAYIKMEATAHRIRHTGVTGFVDTTCNELYRLVEDPAFPPSAVSYQTLQDVGTALRNDIGCIIDDINDYQIHVAALASPSAPTPSYRSLQLAVASIEAYGGILEHEIDELGDGLEKAGELVGTLTEADLAALEAQRPVAEGSSPSTAKLLQLLQQLRRFR